MILRPCFLIILSYSLIPFSPKGSSVFSFIIQYPSNSLNLPVGSRGGFSNLTIPNYSYIYIHTHTHTHIYIYIYTYTTPQGQPHPPTECIQFHNPSPPKHQPKHQRISPEGKGPGTSQLSS